MARSLAKTQSCPARLGGCCMSLAPTKQECKTLILAMMARGEDSLRRLKDLLQVIFDSHRMLSLEGQTSLLLECRLVPTMEAHRVSFDLGLAVAPLAALVPAPAPPSLLGPDPASPTRPPSPGSRLEVGSAALDLLSPAVRLWMQPPTPPPPSRPRQRASKASSSSKRHPSLPRW